jgi:hypothetical protein
MHGVRLKKCVECRHYHIEGISERCALERNTYTNWMGTCYIEHPSQRNLRGNCEHYEKKTD